MEVEKNISMDVINYPEEKKKGEFIIYKTDEKKCPLPGAKFGLYKINSEVKIMEGVSQEQTGKIELKDINVGNYTLKEIEPPKGHKKSEKTWTVKVDKDGKTTISPDNKESSNEITEASAENPGIINKALSIFQPKENNGFLLKPKYEISNPQAIESDGYRLSQTLQATSDPKVYEVSAKIDKISDDLEMVIVFEETPGGSWREGDDQFYKDRINKIIDELSVKNPKAIFSVIGVNDAMHKYVDRKTAVQAKNTLVNAKFTKSTTRAALPNAFEEASNIFRQSNARQKVLVHISGFSYYPTYDDKDEIISKSLKAFNNMKALGVKTNQFIEVNPTNSSHYKDATKSDYPWYAYFENISTAFNTGIYNVSDLKNEFAKLSHDPNYEHKLLYMLSKYNQDIKLNFSPNENFTIIEPTQNLKLDGLEETLGQFSDSSTFTYKVKVDDLLKNISQAPINKLAHIKYKDTTYNFPIPTLTIPRLTLEFTKEWKNTEDSEKSEITVVLKAKTQQGVEISNLSNIGINQNSIKVSADTSWKGSFTNLPQFTKDGERIRYYIEETGIANQKSDFEVKYYYMDNTSVKIENTKIPSITVPNKPSNTFKFRKINSESKQLLQGAKFKLEKGDDPSLIFEADSKKVANQITNVVFESLQSGVYKLSEIKAPEGFTKTDKSWVVVIKEDGEIYWKELEENEKLPNSVDDIDVVDYSYGDLTVENSPLRGKFEILKVDADNRETKLDGVEFTLTKLGEDGQKLTGDENIKRQTTKDGGKAVFSDLSDGKYLLEETKAKDGYQNTFKPINIVVEQAKVYKLGKPEKSEGGSSDTLKTSSSTDKLANISAKIINVDEKNKTFTYRIYANDWTKKNPKGVIYFPKDFLNPTVNIDAGQSGVEIRDIKIKKAPSNLAMDESSFPKEMEDLNMTYFSAYSPEPIITREKSKASIEFNIPDNQYSKIKLLGDGSVAIIDVNASYTGNSINISSSFEYQPSVSSPNKQIAKVENSYTEANQDNKTEIESNIALEITNKKSETDIEFVKIDGRTKDKIGSTTGGLPNYLEAEFALYKWNASSHEIDKYENYKIKVKESESADEIEKDYVVKSNTRDGKFKFEKLPDGKYAIKETKGANGYLKPEDYIVEFEVKDGKVQEALNFKKPFGEIKNSTNYIYNYKGEYPSSGGKGSLIFTLVGLGFMTTTYLLDRKRRKSLRGRR